MIPTTAGWLSKERLGFTLMHEHVFTPSPCGPMWYPWLYDRSEILKKCVKDLSAAKAAGVDTILDVTTPDIGRDAVLVAEAADTAGINVVMATGVYRNVPYYFQPKVSDQATGRSLEDIAAVFIREIEVGIADTGIRAGIIKVASHEEVTPLQEHVLRGAALAAKKTGVPITTHTLAKARTGLRQLEILREEGADLSRVLIGHSITDDMDYLHQLYSSGANVSWDSYLYFAVLPPSERDAATVTLSQLVKEGFWRQTVLSHDYYCWCDYLEYPDFDMTYIHNVVLPRLRQLGVGATEIDEMTVNLPSRLLDQPNNPSA
jgi:phosphotriesterase-related protein